MSLLLIVGKLSLFIVGFGFLALVQFPIHEYGHCASLWVRGWDSDCVVTFHPWTAADARVGGGTYDHFIMIPLQFALVLAYVVRGVLWVGKPTPPPVMYVRRPGSAWEEAVSPPQGRRR